MSRQFKVGLFVILGLFLMMVAIFLIGDTSRLWESKTNYRAAFRDVGGLKPGAPVRMGGLDIGTVHSVGYDKNLGDTRIFVRMAAAAGQNAGPAVNTAMNNHPRRPRRNRSRFPKRERSSATPAPCRAKYAVGRPKPPAAGHEITKS